MYIYKITNIITHKIYVGMTKRTLEKRFKAHIYEAEANKYSMYLHDSIRKYGKTNFTIELIEECDENIAPQKEQHWIKTLNTLAPKGYNLHLGGKGGCLNATPELRKKLSEAKKGKPTWNKGLTKNTDERVAQNGKSISLKTKGVPKSENHKSKMKLRKYATGPRGPNIRTKNKV